MTIEQYDKGEFTQLQEEAAGAVTDALEALSIALDISDKDYLYKASQALDDVARDCLSGIES